MELVTVRREGAAAWVTLNRPDALNALDTALKQTLRAALEELAADDAVRAVALTGNGRAFCVGEDLRGWEQLYRDGGTPAFRDVLEELYAPTVRLLAGMPKPTIACVNGPAAGAGLGLALACDLRVASDTAVLKLAFGGIGLVPDAGTTYHLPRLVGQAKALELTLLDDPVGAEEALRLGLVSRVWPAASFQTEAAALVARLATGPTVAFAQSKRLLRESQERTLADALGAESDAQATAGASDDHREGVLAFLAKRPPDYQGR